MKPERQARGARVRQALLVTAWAVGVMPLAAEAETVAGLDVSVGGTAASNPYLVAGDDTGAVGANATIRPYVTLTDDDDTVTFDGTLNLESFFDDHGTDVSAQVGASAERRLDERTTVSGDIGYRSSESAARRFYNGPDLSNLEPGEFPDNTVVDPTLGSIDGRTSTLDVNVSLTQAVSSNAQIVLTSGLGLTRVSESSSGQDYRNTSTALSYSQRLNERTSLTLSINAGYADYFNRQAGDGLFSTALVGANHQLTETMYGSVQVGLSYAGVKSIFGETEDIITWAANANLCDGLARGTLCVNGSRSAQPTSLGGVTMVTAVGVSYAREFGSAGHASFNASYSKSGISDSSPILLGRRKSEVASVSGTYRHLLGERLSAFITPSYAANDDEFIGKEENYQVLVGISYHFGQTR
jgi:hypothetical protein